MKSKLTCLFLLLAAPLLHAQTTPSLMSYQGRVTDANGVPIGNTTPANCRVTFRLYTGPSDGTALYAETQTVTISGGEFSVLIGNGTGVSGSPGPSAPANTPYKSLSDIINSGTSGSLYLGVTVDDGKADAEREISPRQQMVSGAFSLRAKVAENVAAGAVNTAMMGDGQVTTSKIASGAVDSGRILDSTIVANDIADKTITAGKLDTSTIGLWDTSGDSIFRNSNVGIGTSAPTQKLSIKDGKLWFTTDSGRGDNGGIGGTMADNDNFRIFGAGDNSNDGSLYIDTYDDGNEPIIFRQVTGPPIPPLGTSNFPIERMRIASNGYVGIGTSNPAYKLDIQGGNLRVSNTNPEISITNGNASVDLGVASSQGNYSGDAATGDAVLRSAQQLILQSRAGGAGLIVDTNNNVVVKNTLYGGAIKAAGGNFDRNQKKGYSFTSANGGDDDGGMFSGADGTLQFYTNGWERARITSNGYVGIGYSSPGVPLYVGGSQGWNWDSKSSISSSNSSSGPQIGNPDAFTANGAWYADKNGDINSWPLTIYAEGAIAGSAFVATSDHRIKDIVARSSTRGDLDLINKLQVTDYRLKDSAHAGTAVRKGFIAQEIGKVIPEAVSTSRNFLPDVYQRAVKNLYNAEKKRLSVTVAKPHALAADDWVRLYVDETMLETKVLEVLSPTVFVVASEKAVTKAFVYGRRVDDFLSVDYDRIFTTGIGAIQELDSKLKSESAKVDQLQKKVADLESKFAAQARQSATPKAETADGKAALQSKRGSDLLIDFPATEEIKREKDAEINALKTKNAELEARLSALEKLSAAK